MRRGGNVSGAVSLVMIFCVLCLAVFAVLTLATAQREKTLSDLNASRAESYYAADTLATQIAAELRDGATPDYDVALRETAEGTVAEYSVPFGAEQYIAVRLLLRPDGACEVQRWASVYGGDWQTDDSIDIWDGGF